MFEGLINRFQIIRRKVTGYGRITTQELDDILKDIRITLLEADVNYKVVKEFIESLRKKCLDLQLGKSLKPGDLVIKAVYEELTALLGTSVQYIEFKKPPLVMSLLGLQGVGKTTTAVKLALRFKGKKPLLVPADVKRPAAVQQLKTLADRADIPVHPLVRNDAVVTAQHAFARAEKEGNDLVLIDTAGRMHVDEYLVSELRLLHQAVPPHYSLLVADGMSGQDAVNQAVVFSEEIGLDGAILTKMDGDARGGAALSIVRAGGVPIFYIGTGEGLDGLDEFHPDRMAQRILGMGDVVSLVEKVKTIEHELDQKKIQRKVITGDLNFVDFLEQLKSVKKLGPLSKIAAMIPGVKEADVNENEMKKIEAIINSMTIKERMTPSLLDGSRKRRIAAGSGTRVQDVNQLLKQFKMAREMLKKMGKDFKFKI